MKQILFILYFLIYSFPMVAHSSFYPVGKAGAKTSYRTKEMCEASESQLCFNIKDKDMRRWMVADVLEDDLNQPIYRAADNSPVKIDCLDFDDCQSKALDPDGDVNNSDRVCLSDPGSQEKWDELTNWPGMTGVTGPWFIWCQLRTGYAQKSVKKLVSDPSGIDQADAEDAQKASDKAARDTAKPIRLTALQQCVQDSKNPTLSPSQIKDCIAALVREILGDQVNVNDL